MFTPKSRLGARAAVAQGRRGLYDEEDVFGRVRRTDEPGDDVRRDVEGRVREDLVRLTWQPFRAEIAAPDVDVRTFGEAGAQRGAERPVDLVRDDGAAAVGERRGDCAGASTDLVDEVSVREPGPIDEQERGCGLAQEVRGGAPGWARPA